MADGRTELVMVLLLADATYLCLAYSLGFAVMVNEAKSVSLECSENPMCLCCVCCLFVFFVFFTERGPTQ